MKSKVATTSLAWLHSDVLLHTDYSIILNLLNLFPPHIWHVDRALCGFSLKLSWQQSLRVRATETHKEILSIMDKHRAYLCLLVCFLSVLANGWMSCLCTAQALFVLNLTYHVVKCWWLPEGVSLYCYICTWSPLSLWEAVWKRIT